MVSGRSVVGGRRLLAVCFGQFPYNLPLHVAIAGAAVACCFHCFSALLCSVLCYFFFVVFVFFFWVNSFTEKQLKRIIPTQICGHKLLMDSIEHDQKRGWPWVWMGRLEWDAGGGRGMSRQLSLCCEYKLCHKN